MEAPMNEDLTYQYYRILREDSTDGHVFENNIITVNLSEIHENVELSNDPSSNESLESFDVVNGLQFDLGNNNMKYTSLENVGEFLETSTIDENTFPDEHFDTIEPTLLNFNHDIGYNESQHIGATNTDTGLLESSDDSYTENDLLISVNENTESNSGEMTCNKTYATSCHLRAHVQTDADPKPYKCPLDSCGKCFRTSSGLKTHMKSHPGEKTFNCLSCSQVFKTSGEKRKHSKMHTGDKQFPCKVQGCTSTFTTSKARTVHTRSHTGVRPYRCSHPGCGKTFTISANHKSHERIHSGEKPYACTFQGCDKRFTEYSTMYKHLTAHRNDEATWEKLQSILDTANVHSDNL